jgi:hypothetical protein
MSGSGSTLMARPMQIKPRRHCTACADGVSEDGRFLAARGLSSGDAELVSVRAGGRIS